MAQMDTPRSEDPVESTASRKDGIEESCVVKLDRPEDGPSVSPNPLPAEHRSLAFLQKRACEDDDARMPRLADPAGPAEIKQIQVQILRP